jgi:hypothetical protein
MAEAQRENGVRSLSRSAKVRARQGEGLIDVPHAEVRALASLEALVDHILAGGFYT